MPSNFPTATTEASSSRDHAPSIAAVTSGPSHTPGPWRLYEGGTRQTRYGIEAAAESVVIYGCDDDSSGVYGRTPEEAAANARLIAAAPELLRGLKHEVANCPMCKGDGVTDQTFDHIIGHLPSGQKVECPRCKESSATIAQAEGRV